MKKTTLMPKITKHAKNKTNVYLYGYRSLQGRIFIDLYFIYVIGHRHYGGIGNWTGQFSSPTIWISSTNFSECEVVT